MIRELCERIKTLCGAEAPIPPAAIFLLCFSLTAFAADKPKEPVRIPSGIEWLSGSMGERFDQVIAAMAILSQSEVNLEKTPADYYTALEKRLKRTPAENQRILTQILADIVYETEPRSRLVLDKLRH